VTDTCERACRPIATHHPGPRLAGVQAFFLWARRLHPSAPLHPTEHGQPTAPAPGSPFEHELCPMVVVVGWIDCWREHGRTLESAPLEGESVCSMASACGVAEPKRGPHPAVISVWQGRGLHACEAG